MKRNLFLQVIIVCFLFFAEQKALSAQLSEENVQNWVNDKGTILLNTFNETNLEQKYKELDSLFESYIDLEYVSQFVAGKYWRQMTDAQKKKYQQLFHRYALSLYKGFPLNFENRLSFKITKTEITPKYADVWTSITLAPKNPDETSLVVNVIFRLHETDGKIKIIDLTMAESSLILSYRSRFYQMFMDADDDIDWFLEDLEMIVVSNEKNNGLELQKFRMQKEN